MSTTEALPKTPFEWTMFYLHGEVTWLHHHWKLFIALFGGADDSQVALMNKRSGVIFGTLERMAADLILLEIAKLLSKKESANKKVVSLERAIYNMPSSVPVERRQGLQRRFDDLRKKHEQIIVQRDRRIAHNDQAVMSGATRLDPPLKTQIDEA